MRLSGKKALVTGAASGIGRAIASRFVEEGAHVACLDINEEALKDTVDELKINERVVVGITTDVSVPRDVEHAAETAISELGGLDIVINNAGANTDGNITEFNHERWNKAIALNLTSFFSMSRCVWPLFVRQGYGVIVNTSSIMGITGARNSFAYCTCKAGIIALTKSLAADGGPLGIRVNCVCPGFVHTPIMDQVHSEEAQLKITKQLPAKRMAMPSEVADGFVYLASDEASYANGTVLVLDGAATVGFGGCYVESD